ncbi:hybrid signal transduction histidine kinase K [Acrasis kona]|uniref:Hybrid signal transduction histidine kinase K n=1 Tax=Acrasis kona TaxID=1008807 RepID=A0AAW2YVG8_9EUKA
MKDEPWYEPMDVLYASTHSQVIKARFIGPSTQTPYGTLVSGTKVIVKTLSPDSAKSRRAESLRREFDLVQHILDSGRHENIIRLLLFLKKGEDVAILMEDNDCRSLLSAIPSSGFTIPLFLNYAIKIVKGIQSIHDAGVIHKDIKPSNMILRSDGEISQIDFGCATRLQEETEQGAPNTIQRIHGTLAYISPEQTGRVNRTIDYRSDFYSLGITFYQMLTGSVPFPAMDMVSVIHAHIASQAPPLPTSIPQVIRDIVFKLLEKDADERYQSCRGLLYDLETCLNKLKPNTNHVEPFAVGTRDYVEKFSMPKKLYGREVQTKQLIDLFEQVCSTGKMQVIFVSGYSGIGKSSLIREIQKTVQLHNGHFITGKFDQFERNIAYSAISDALQSLIKQIIDNNVHINWKEKLDNVLDPKFSQLLIDLIPSLKDIIGPQQPPPKMSATETKNVLMNLFGNLIISMTGPEMPLVLLLDDIQWSDRESLHLIRILLEHIESHTLLIISYRDNEITPDHIVVPTLKYIRDKVNVVDITLGPLHIDQVGLWIKDAIQNEHATDLSNIVYEKTNGNPFFVKLFVESLVQDGLLWRDVSLKQWTWDMEQIKALSVTENVIHLMSRRIEQFNNVTKEAISWMSCLGNNCLLSRLAISMNKDEYKVMDDLYPALNASLLQLVGNRIYFAHDRVQEVAYSRLNIQEKSSKHYCIASRWLSTHSQSNSPPQGKDLCEIVDHMNKGRFVIEGDLSACKELIRYNIQAGVIALNSSAYSTADSYFRSGVDLFCKLHPTVEESWTKDRSLGIQLYMKLATSQRLMSYYKSANEIYEMLLIHAKDDDMQIIEIYSQIVELGNISGLSESWLKSSVGVLRYYGVDLPDIKDISEIQKSTQFYRDCIDSKLSKLYTDAEQISIRVDSLILELQPRIKIFYDLLLNLMVVAQVNGQVALSVCLSAIGVNAILQYGISGNSSAILTLHSSIMLDTRSEKGYRLGKLFSELMLKCSFEIFVDDHAQRVRAVHLYCHLIHHWIKPIRQAMDYSRECYSMGNACGETIYAVYSMVVTSTIMLYGGYHLVRSYEEVQHFLNIAKKNNNTLTCGLISSYSFIMRHLMNHIISTDIIKEEKKRFLSEVYDCESGGGFAYTEHKMLRFMIKVILFCDDRHVSDPLGFAKKLIKKLSAVVKLERFVTKFYVNVIFNFYSSLLIIKAIRLCGHCIDSQTRDILIGQLDANQSNLQTWSHYCAENFINKYTLVSAEYAAYVKVDVPSALRLYDLSVDYCTKYNLLHERAIAYECYGKFCKSIGMKILHESCIQSSFDDYYLWGAHRKVNQLLSDYPLLVKPARMSHSDDIETPTMTNNNPYFFDLQNIIKTTQIISSSIDMNVLLMNVIKVIKETAGATSMSVIIDGKVEATCGNNGEIRTMCNMPLELWNKGNMSIVKHVLQTRQKLLIGCAHSVTQDFQPVGSNLCKSILCMPITYQGNLTGVLYLSNELMSDCFKPECVLVLTVLASQLAISIQHSKQFDVQMRSMEQLANIQKKRAEEEVYMRSMEQLARVQRKRAEEEESYRLKQEEFIDRICHEIRNPIQGILGNCEVISGCVSQIKKSHQVESNIRTIMDSIESIVVCGQYQKVVTNDVLTLSKLELGKVTLNPTPVRLLSIFQSAVSMNAVEASRKNILLSCNNANLSNDLTVDMDGDRLMTVLMNLITNAIKFTSSGSVVISFSMDAQNALHISVKDTGCGMTESEMAGLFNRFSQATQRIYSDYGGSGLGLYISKAIVDMMGGTISVSSTKGVGTEFKFSFKCTLSNTNDSAVESQQQSKQVHLVKKKHKIPSTTLRKTRALVAEDNNINQRVVVRMLEKLKCECMVSNNGKEALDIFIEHGPFDLIIMDIVMPLMDGYESTKRIRQHESDANVENGVFIIGLSGNVRKEYHDAGIEAGMDRFLNKPISQKDFNELMLTLRD